ncbi:MAG: DUF1080 domain-containing protein [Verrucomicrobiota bacterium]
MKNFLQLIVIGSMIISANSKAETNSTPKAWIDGNEPGWRALGEKDFAAVNCKPETFTWTNGMIHCTGQPVGVLRSQNVYTNFEMIAQWRHLSNGGNSGFYVWASPESIKGLEKGINAPFPSGIEVQVLDHGYTEQYEKSSGKKADWFTTNGDVFPVGNCIMNPFSPTAPGGGRSFPRKNLSKGSPEWNHYYVRCINGEVRLWVNGEEVSGGNNCKPASGYFCIESEGAPIDFKEIKIRELP